MRESIWAALILLAAFLVPVLADAQQWREIEPWLDAQTHGAEPPHSLYGANGQEIARCFGDQAGITTCIAETFQGQITAAHVGPASPLAGCFSAPCPEFDALGAGPFPSLAAGNGGWGVSGTYCDGPTPGAYETFTANDCPATHKHGGEAEWPLRFVESDPLLHSAWLSLSIPWVYCWGPGDCTIVPVGWETWSAFSHLGTGATAGLGMGADQIELVVRPWGWGDSFGPLRLEWWNRLGEKVTETHDFQIPAAGPLLERTYTIADPEGIAGWRIDWAPGVIWYSVENVRSLGVKDADADGLPDQIDPTPGCVPGVGADFDDSGTVNPTDFTDWFVPQFTAGTPWPPCQ